MSRIAPGDEIILAVTDHQGWDLGIRKIRVHPEAVCDDREYCCVHRPGPHRMRDWPMRWRYDIKIMMRTCPHGIGHSDPDHVAYVRSLSPELASAQEFHHRHCDGCCKEEP